MTTFVAPTTITPVAAPNTLHTDINNDTTKWHHVSAYPILGFLLSFSLQNMHHDGWISNSHQLHCIHAWYLCKV